MNYVDALEFLASIRESVMISFRNGLRIDCARNDRAILYTLLELSDDGLKLVDSNSDDHSYAWKVTWQNRTIATPQGLAFRLRSVVPAIFIDTFIYDSHFVSFELNEKDVVDIGAFVGDTALYYASQGAYVYAYEPNPTNYNYLLENLELNPELKNRVKPYNSAAGVDGKVSFFYKEGPLGGVDGSGTTIEASAILKNMTRRKMIEVNSHSLSTIMKQNALDSGFLLKSDCKGAEIDLIKDRAISRFHAAKIDYTLFGLNVTLNDLVQQLRSNGFKNMRIFKQNRGRYDLVVHGTILAAK